MNIVISRNYKQTENNHYFLKNHAKPKRCHYVEIEMVIKRTGNEKN